MSIEIAQKYGIGVTYKGDDGGLYFKDEAGNVTSFTDPDQLVKISSDDTTASYLESKLVAGSNVTLTTNNSGGNETITIAAAADNDEKAKVSANDTTSGYLDGKLVAGSGITLTQNNDGGNETLTITANVADTNDKARVSANDTTPGYLNGKLVAGANVTFTEGNDGGDETLTIAAAGGVTGFTGSQNTASPNNTVNASRLLVDATSTDADAVLQPKGAGAILAKLPDGAITGGNKRGSYAVDLQLEFNAANSVASGAYAVALGRYNRVTGNTSVGIGSSNTSTASRSLAIGEFCIATADNSICIGKSSTASGQASVALGELNTASGFRSFATGTGSTASGQTSFAAGESVRATGSASTALGSSTQATTFYAFASGNWSLANAWAMRAHSSQPFASLADCQEERYIVGRRTTDATQAELSCDYSSPTSGRVIAIASDATYTFSALVTARRTDADNESAGYKIEGVIDNNAGTTAFVGTPVVTVLGEDTAAWDVVVEADNTNDRLAIKVTGEANKTIRWAATVLLMKVAG